MHGRYSDGIPALDIPRAEEVDVGENVEDTPRSAAHEDLEDEVLGRPEPAPTLLEDNLSFEYGYDTLG